MQRVFSIITNLQTNCHLKLIKTVDQLCSNLLKMDDFVMIYGYMFMQISYKIKNLGRYTNHQRFWIFGLLLLPVYHKETNIFVIVILFNIDA